jgi:hypothetical protein
MNQIIAPLNWELVDTFEFVGGASNDELKKAEAFGRSFADAISQSE